MSSPDPFGDALEAQASSAPSANDDAFGAALSRRAAGTSDAPPKSPVDALLSQEKTSGPIGFINGLGEIAGKGILNIPMAAVHGAYDLASRATGHGPKPSEPTFPLSENAQSVGQGIGDAVGAAAQPYRVKAAEPFLNNYVAPVLGDVGAIAAGAGAAKIIAGGVAAKVPITANAAQEALNKSVALNAQSMGASAAAPDITNASLPLQASIEEASAKGTKPLNMQALQRQVKADEFGISLTHGQATQDNAQLADEFNTRNQNPAFAERKVQTNQKLIDGINGIKEDVAPAAAVDHEANAQTVIDAYKDKYAPIAADAKAKWTKFQDAAGGALPLEPGDFTTQVGAALKKSGKTRYLPSEVAGDIKDIDDGEPFTVERWDNLKTNLAGAQRTAERTGNGNAALAISAARDAVENYHFPNLDPKLQAMNQDARAATAAKYKMLRADPAMDTAVNDGVPRGQLSPEAKGYMEKYFLKGNKADLANSQANLAANADAKGAIAGSVTNELKKAAGIDLYRNDGNFSQSGYNTRLNELQPRIHYLMDREAADKAFRLGDVARDVMRQPTGLAFNNSGTSTVAKLAKRVGTGVISAGEHLANVATGKLQLGSNAREEVAKWMDSKWVEDSLKPGAGIDRLPKNP